MYAEYEQPESPKRGREAPTLLPLAPALLGHRKISLCLFFISPTCMHACVHACVCTHVCKCFCAIGSVNVYPIRDSIIRILFAYWK